MILYAVLGGIIALIAYSIGFFVLIKSKLAHDWISSDPRFIVAWLLIVIWSMACVYAVARWLNS